MRGHAECRACPDLFHLFVLVQDIAIGGYTVYRAHGSILELHYVEVEHMLKRGTAHLRRDNLAKAGEVCVPLARELLGHDV